tara:strand:- start:12239 stop:13972 length:1734 start_codon:yes stop_codon:yes gene_type:complete
MRSAILQILSDSGCTDVNKVRDLARTSSQGLSSLNESILSADLVEEENFLEKVSHHFKMDWLPEPEPDLDQRKALQKACKAGVVVRHRILPIRFEGDPDDSSAKLIIATSDPFDVVTRQMATREFAYPLRWVLAPQKRVLEGIQALYGVGADTFEAILEGRSDFDSNSDLKEETTDLDENDAEASVVRFVNDIIRDALNQRSTDIHLEPLSHDLRIRYRIDGVLQEVPVPEQIKTLQSSVISRLKVMARLDIAEKRKPQDGRIALQLDGRSIDVRVATIPSVEGESISLRLLGQESFSLDRLGLIEAHQKTIDQLLKEPNGIVLVTGPTGSGKSTTLYTFLSALNDGSHRIVTVEDPVEHKLPGVIQIAVKPDIDLTFAAGLRSILRADPNVIMVGEIRDLETAEIAIRSALTGHLVFSTLHTNDAIGGITRLVDMGVEPFLVGASVRAFIGQRLVRRLCPDCRVPANYSTPELDTVEFPSNLRTDGNLHTAKPGGCKSCRGTGYRGRIAIFEICRISEALQDLIVGQKPYASLRRQAEAEGFISMRQYGWMKVAEGETTLEEVVSATADERNAGPK